MTQKELSYVEDAIGHENSIIKICQESVKILDNDELISFLDEEITKHTSAKEKLTNLLEEKANG